MTVPELERVLDVLLEATALKALPRAGWVRTGVPAPETVASHSWGVAWLVLVLLPDGMDRARALTYAVLHDLPEVRTGDIMPSDPVTPSEKAAREHAAMAALAAPLDPRGIELIWNAYESQEDAEARFVRQLDRVDMALQALRHHRDGNAGMREFLESADRFVTHPALRPLMDALRARWALT